MTRAPFTGPIRSVGGFEVGEADDVTTVINSSGTVVGNVGSTATPATVYGYLSGAFAGNVVSEVSTAAASGLPAVASGYFRLFYSSTGGLLLKTSTGTVGTVTVT